MRVLKQQIKQIIKEHLDEVAIDKLTQEGVLDESSEHSEIMNITDLKKLFHTKSHDFSIETRFSPTEARWAVRELERAEAWLRRYRLAEDAPTKELKET